MDAEEARRQREQLGRYLKWVESEGGSELPTQLDTLLGLRQVRRIRWLKRNAIGTILEVGCNFGYVLASVGGHAGCDTNPHLIGLAKLLARHREFKVGDACALPYPDGSFDTVILPEVLEHIPYKKGYIAIAEAIRAAKRRVLITMPEGNTDTPDAISQKHVWLATTEAVTHMMGQVSMNISAVHLPVMQLRNGFWLVKLNLRRSR